MDLRAEVKLILADLVVDNTVIPFDYMTYDGHGEDYIVFLQYDKDNSYSADDEIAGFVEYFDIDIYSQGNYLGIIKEVKNRFKAYGWTYQPRRDSPDMYDADTRYYHKTLCFAKEIQEDGEVEPGVITPPIDDISFPLLQN